MEDNYKYKIIQAVDPTKIKVPINDKFSKLTLSSNKKKKANFNGHDNVQEIGNDSARNRVSRNLMEELSVIASQSPNLLLRSGSPEKNLEGTAKFSIMDAHSVRNGSDWNLNHSARLNNTQSHNKKNIEIEFSPRESLESEVICLSTSESAQSYNEKSVISLSDTSESNCMHEPHEMLLSNVTTDNCIIKEKDKQLKAFLNDVALEYHNRAIEGNLNNVSNNMLIENGRNSSEILKYKRMATADTESMTPGDDFDDNIQSAILERDKRLKALDNSLTNVSPANKKVYSPLIKGDEHSCNVNENIVDLTHIDESINTSAQIPMESIVISETDDETNDDDNSNNTSKREMENQQMEKTSYAKLSHNISSSNNDESEYNEAINDITASSNSDLDDLQIKMGNINLSAKIKVNIQIRSESTDGEEDEVEANDTDKNQNLDASHRNSSDNLNVSSEENQEKNSSNVQSPIETEQHLNTRTTMPTIARNRKVLERNESKKSLAENHNMFATTIDATDSILPTEATTDSNTSVKFVSQAEKLLSQLYGNTWQTPEVVRTLSCIAPTDSQMKLSLEKNIQKGEEDHDANSTTFNCTSHMEKSVEESALDNFSIFRRNIGNHLDSTRCLTKSRKKDGTAKEKVQVSRNNIHNDFKKPLSLTNSNTRSNQKQRKLVFDDQNQWDDSGNNASDDTDIDWTQDNDAIIEKFNSNSSDDDDDLKKKRNVRKTKKSSKDKVPSNDDAKDPNELVYLDLSKREVEIQKQMPQSPPANRDENFMTELQNILETCHRNEPVKLPSVRSETKSRRKLFTPNYGDEDTNPEKPQTPQNKNAATVYDEYLNDSVYLPFDCRGILVNKQLESVKTCKPIFAITPPSKQRTVSKETSSGHTPRSTKKIPNVLRQDNCSPFKYNFLKSLDVCVSKSLCHPDALIYRENYRTKKEQLSKVLYDLYNEKVFDNKLDVPLTWNKKLCNTAGRCLNRKRMGVRCCTIELSDKVLTSADRLRCTLIHEMCHAATWIFNGEGGHGATWRSWAQRSNAIFPEIPKIGVCHQYDIEYKYTYKCSLCGAKSHAHSKSKKVENIRCAYCHGAIEIFLNKKDKEGNVMQTPVKEATGFAKFVKDNYRKYKRDDLKHTDIMKTLSAEFAAMKMTKA